MIILLTQAAQIALPTNDGQRTDWVLISPEDATVPAGTAKAEEVAMERTQAMMVEGCILNFRCVRN